MSSPRAMLLALSLAGALVGTAVPARAAQIDAVPPPSDGGDLPASDETRASVSHGAGGAGRRLLLAPFIGAHSFPGDHTGRIGVGWRAGLLAGWRLRDWISLNGEVLVDVLNKEPFVAGVPLTAQQVEVAFSPLGHVGLGARALLVAGPRLAGMMSLGQEHVGGASNDTQSEGLSVGAQVGAFYRIRPGAGVGVIVGAAWRRALHRCYRRYGSSEQCTFHGLSDGWAVVGATAAVLF